MADVGVRALRIVEQEPQHLVLHALGLAQEVQVERLVERGGGLVSTGRKERQTEMILPVRNKDRQKYIPVRKKNRNIYR